MKPVTILAIIVGVVVVVGAILFIDQNNQIVMMKNQNMLENQIDWCGAKYMFDIPALERCAIRAFETYGTQEQLDSYLQALEDEREAELRAEENREFLKNKWILNCREKYIGQQDMLNRCLEFEP